MKGRPRAITGRRNKTRRCLPSTSTSFSKYAASCALYLPLLPTFPDMPTREDGEGENSGGRRRAAVSWGGTGNWVSVRERAERTQPFAYKILSKSKTSERWMDAPASYAH